MALQISLAGERLGAELAEIGPLAGVCPQVHLETARIRECFPAEFAHVFPLVLFVHLLYV